jgi:hypothetical protein
MECSGRKGRERFGGHVLLYIVLVHHPTPALLPNCCSSSHQTTFLMNTKSRPSLADALKSLSAALPSRPSGPLPALGSDKKLSDWIHPVFFDIVEVARTQNLEPSLLHNYPTVSDAVRELWPVMLERRGAWTQLWGQEEVKRREEEEAKRREEEERVCAEEKSRIEKERMLAEEKRRLAELFDDFYHPMPVFRDEAKAETSNQGQTSGSKDTTPSGNTSDEEERDTTKLLVDVKTETVSDYNPLLPCSV